MIAGRAGFLGMASGDDMAGIDHKSHIGDDRNVVLRFRFVYYWDR